ncbi:TetR family transcriptional regulator [Paraburkholderia unamae]|uniref:TetR family transcriptional regulator n=2 Tax=Paraburkholderia unamae TaxID=219649 RepID=A0ABX5K9Q3_9BURK|nr:TetR family transcriptional regulator [Paraburkholderia unamae]CAG9274994.1 DNA-binding transcriptional regulator, AcrR family [Paraburkholderia unamae]
MGRMASEHKSEPVARSPGRPREFDMETVVNGAVRVFRERGYHATSVGDLSDATGLTAGSLYKAFGDKRGVFLAAFDHYVSVRNDELRHRLNKQPNARAKIRAMLHFYAESSHGSEGRRGCLVVSSATALATFDDEIAARIETTMRRTEDMLRELLQQGQKDGSIAPQVQAAAMARTLLALLHGFRLIGKSGRTLRDMLASADEAMRLLD